MAKREEKEKKKQTMPGHTTVKFKNIKEKKKIPKA